jgi:hypothetical protein
MNGFVHFCVTCGIIVLSKNSPKENQNELPFVLAAQDKMFSQTKKHADRAKQNWNCTSVFIASS